MKTHLILSTLTALALSLGALADNLSPDARALATARSNVTRSTNELARATTPEAKAKAEAKLAKAEAALAALAPPKPPVSGPVVVPGEKKAVHITSAINNWGVIWPRIVTLVGGAVVGDLMDDQDGDGLCKAEAAAYGFMTSIGPRARGPMLAKTVDGTLYYSLDFINAGDTGYEFIIEGSTDGVLWSVVPFTGLRYVDGINENGPEITSEELFAAAKLGKAPNQAAIQFKSKTANQLLRLRLVIPQK